MSNVIDFNNHRKNKNTDSDKTKWAFNQPHQPTSITFSFDDDCVFNYTDLPNITFGIEEFLKDVKATAPNNPALDQVHDASFDICLYCEEHPDVAEYAERKLRELHKALIFYKNNNKKG